MKKLLSVFLWLLCMPVYAQFVPGQVLTAAQLNAALAAKATIPGNCLGSSFALTYQNPGNVWGCNGTINAATLNGNTFSSPGTIGGVSPGAATFTNVAANGTITLANNSLAFAYLPQLSANSVAANFTGASGNVASYPVPSCNAATSALGYASGSGFNCNSAVNASTLGGATFASPGAIGSTTASTGRFTTLQATSTITPSTTAGIVGTTLADVANAGSVGETVSCTFSAVNITTTGVAQTLCNMNLSAGDWDVTAYMLYMVGTGATMNIWLGAINTVTNALPSLGNYWQSGGAITATGGASAFAPVSRQNVSTTTTVYCIGEAVFSGGAVAATGYMRARRIR